MPTALLSAPAIWRIAELLRGVVPPGEYGPVILAFTVLRRLELARGRPVSALAAVASVADPLARLETLLGRLPAPVRGMMAQMEMGPLATRLARAGVLGRVAAHFAALDLSPALYGTQAMARLFEELVRHFDAGQATGAHYTPPEIGDLMTDLVFAPDAAGTRHALYDPAAGTGVLLGRAADRLAGRGVAVDLFGQEISARACAICQADMLLRGRNPAHILPGNTLAVDHHASRRFARMLANPPFGVDWRAIRPLVQAEHATGSAGRFAAGLPRVADGSMLFMLHLLARMRAPARGGARVGMVTHGAALAGGGADSGESAIRRHLVDHDLIDTVIALPGDMFVNTGIATYVWILDNRKPAGRQGMVRLVDATGLWRRCPRSSGEKRREMTQAHIATVVQAALAGTDMDLIVQPGADGAPARWQAVACDGPEGQDGTGCVPLSRIVPGRDFLYRSVSVERRVREAGAAARTTFTMDMADDPDSWFARMILPFDPTAKLDMARCATGCAISFARYFSRPAPPRPLAAIRAELRRSMARLAALMPGDDGD
ncbi:Type I restriction enzyme EcoprrI M protein [Gluconacetobacter sp. SXCC-1]|uniref:class I SAM-dependent DNA methyltransferase n=1 Tax=Komagataeibacter rhaeticus TaxID=215221 RepID=UPI000207F9E0|nr:class I SAM-dependent DNA methyltransferase [Komagataeibacter rhaeticus]ATU72624.1 SAM-dependent DNA methyltransferase [Komagataeibacter xylinus]EGG74625.1 Type I restriction enzyme EcoprrI M protein [Gluconacetobacter sp. SXCC-1]WPP22379.1 class I SAM-dependent DNA methyltransferase [Komagataeibacter rhaeticus]